MIVVAEIPWLRTVFEPEHRRNIKVSNPTIGGAQRYFGCKGRIAALENTTYRLR
jgi:hypothetical protein